MIVTAININSRTIKYLVTRDNGIVDWGAVPLAGNVKNGIILEPRATGNQLKSLFTSGKLPGDRVICTVNGMPFSYRFFPLPKMEQPALHEAISRVARREMPIPFEDMHLSWQAYPAGDEEWQVMVSGITRRPVEALARVLSDAGIRPYILDLPHLALARLTDRRDVIIVDFEPDFSGITLVIKGMPLGMHTVPSIGPEASLQEEIKQLINELVKMVGFYNNGHPESPIAPDTPVLLTGVLSEDSTVAQSVREETGYPVESLVPALDIPPELPVSMFAVGIGAAMNREVQDNDKGRDELPFHSLNMRDVIRECESDRKTGSRLKKLVLPVALAASTCSLMTAFYFQDRSENGITQLKAELEQANIGLNQRLATETDAEQIEDSINEILASTREIEQANRNMLDSLDYVSDINSITRSMPGGMSFNSMDIESNQIIIQGNTPGPFPVVEFVKNLEMSGKFSKADIIWLDRPRNVKTDTGISFMVTVYR